MLNATKIFLTVIFVIAFCCPFALGYSSVDGSELYKSGITYEYVHEERVLILSGSGDISDYDKPESVPWGKYRNFANKIIIKDGINRIGNYAFFDFRNVTSIVIPNSLKSIGDFAFYGMEKMTHFPVSPNIEYGKSVFSFTGITEFTLYCDVSERMFSGCKSLKSVKFTDKVSSIGDSAFFGCMSLESINIPDSTLIIGKEAFRFCKNLSLVRLPNTIDLGSGAFKECRSLTSIVLPNNIKVLNAELFKDANLTSILIPKSVELIGNDAFSGCDLLKDIMFLSSDAPMLEEGAFKLTEIGPNVVATIHSLGWANDDIFTSSIKGDRVSFNYKPIEIRVNDMVITAGTKTISNVVPEGTSVSITGADWLESKGNTIFGTPTVPGDYKITLMCGHLSKTVKIRVVPPLSYDKFQSNKSEIVTVENVNQNTFKFSASVDGIWDFGDGTVSKDKCVEHIFLESGLHQIKFTHSDGVQYVTALVINESPAMHVATGSLYAYCPGIDYTVTTNCPGLSWDDKTLSLKGYPSSIGEYIITVDGIPYKLNVKTGTRQINHDFEIIIDGPNVTVKAASAGTLGITYWWKIANLSGKIVAEGITEKQKFTINKPGDYICTCTIIDSNLKQSDYSKKFSIVTSTESNVISDSDENELDFKEKRASVYTYIQSVPAWVWVIFIFTVIFIVKARDFHE